MIIKATRKWFVVVAQQWLNAFKVFSPKNLKDLVLVSCNAWWQGSIYFFKQFWPIILAFSVPWDELGLRGLGYFQFDGINVCVIFMRIYLIGFALLSVRPSVVPKDNLYPKKYFKYLFHLFLGVVLFALSLKIFFRLLATVSTPGFRQTILHITFILPNIGSFIQFSPLFVVLTFLFLDSNGTFEALCKSSFRSIKLVFYGYWFYALVATLVRHALWPGASIVLQPAYLFLQSLLGNTGIYLFVLALCIYVQELLLFMLYASFLHTFYTKQLQNNPKLYA